MLSRSGKATNTDIFGIIILDISYKIDALLKQMPIIILDLPPSQQPSYICRFLPTFFTVK
jgi:hypothetical protein